MNNVITIDGPSGSGKGTVCHRLSTKLGWRLLDSGALYRLSALAAERAGVALNDEHGVAVLAADMQVEFGRLPNGVESIRLNGEEVAREVRMEATGEKASKVAVHPRLRATLVQVQHDFAQPPGLIADGRDMGTVIFPDALVKIFLIASAEERAQRRLKQMQDLGLLQPDSAGDNLRALVEDISARDARDANRSLCPMKPADDAVVIDSTGRNIDDVEAEVWQIIHARQPTWLPK